MFGGERVPNRTHTHRNARNASANEIKIGEQIKISFLALITLVLCIGYTVYATRPTSRPSKAQCAHVIWCFVIFSAFLLLLLRLLYFLLWNSLVSFRLLGPFGAVCELWMDGVCPTSFVPLSFRLTRNRLSYTLARPSTISLIRNFWIIEACTPHMLASGFAAHRTNRLDE